MGNNDMWAGDDKWKGNYIRAQWAGRVTQPDVFPKILDAIKLGETDAGNKAFSDACMTVMQDIEEGKRKKLIRDMWTATWASRKLGDQVKSCW